MTYHFAKNSRLETILNHLCKEIEIPVVSTNPDPENKAKQLIESMEEKEYPYPTLSCPHREEKGIDEDCVECIYQQYEIHKERYFSLRKEKSGNHAHTLQAAFDYYTSLITQYRLTECDELINTIYPICLARGKWSKYYISAIQARSFLRFKEGRYQDSLEDFHKQIETLGPHDAIYENMALVYSRLNQSKEACACYARAILLIQQKPHVDERFATLLMGLSTVLEDSEDALVVLQESLTLLRKRFTRPHSLIAKTLSALGDLHTKKQDRQSAEKYYQEAVDIFIDTCGLDTPLTANAMTKHARSLFLLDQKAQATDMAIRSLSVWTQVDNISFEPNAVFESLNIVREQEPSSVSPAPLIPTLKRLQNKIENNNVLSQDINVLCLLKFIYEIFIIYKTLPEALTCCQSLATLLSKLNPSEELLPIRDKLLKETHDLLMVLKTINLG